MILANQSVLGAKVLVLGLTFKENCPDIRNSKVPDIVNELKEFGAEVVTYEPLANPDEVQHEYGFKPSTWDDVVKNKYQLVIAAVAHNEFKELNTKFFSSITEPSSVFVDVKGLYSKKDFQEKGMRYWRL